MRDDDRTSMAVPTVQVDRTKNLVSPRWVSIFPYEDIHTWNSAPMVVKGIYVSWTNDPPNPKIKDWNVTELKVGQNVSFLVQMAYR